jgi:hypothetical protein
MNYLEAYWKAANTSNSYWGQCQHNGQMVVLATFAWPPAYIQSNSRPQTRHIVFLIDGSESALSRSISYEPSSGSQEYFLGEARRDGLRINHGKIPQMTREEFWDVALIKLFGSSPSPKLSPPPPQSAKPWWKFWK